MRVDYAVTVPGLIRGSFCHTLITDSGNLYILRVIRGWRVNPVMSRQAQQYAVDSVIAKLKQKAQAATAQLTNENKTEYAGKKGSSVLPLAEISDVQIVQRSDNIPELHFVGAGKKYRFVLDGTSMQAAEEFAVSIGK